MYGIPDSRIQEFLLQESRILGFGIRNTAQGIRNPTDKESGIQYFESEIHGAESRIQDCLGFPYMEDGGGRGDGGRGKGVVAMLAASLYLFHYHTLTNNI